MTTQPDYLEALGQQLRQFTAERGWTIHHTPKNLAMALAGEAGELVAELQWLTPDQSERSQMSPAKLEAVESEMADVLIYLVQLANRLDTNLPDITSRKMALNARRFPLPEDPDTTRS